MKTPRKNPAKSPARTWREIQKLLFSFLDVYFENSCGKSVNLPRKIIEFPQVFRLTPLEWKINIFISEKQ